MLKKIRTLKGYKLNGLDGEIGSIRDFYFDDHFWAIRYLVANTGNWLNGRYVLISPYALFVATTKEAQLINIDLTRKQIKDSPSLETDKPVSQQFEQEYYDYYGWPAYSSGSYMWGDYPHIMRDQKRWKEATLSEKQWDPNLRSMNAVKGYYIKAEDGDIGHIVDFVIDDETWAIRYLVIDTSNWWRGKKVLVSPYWIERVSWDESQIFVNLSREAIRQSPEYSEGALLNRDYEARLFGHYNRKGYWLEEPVATEQPNRSKHN